jgi:hypothetical protein
MTAKVPLALVCAVVAFGLGAIAGAGAMAGFGKEPWADFGTQPSVRPAGAAVAPGMPGGGGPGGGGPGAGGPGGGGPGGGGPSALTRLALLVAKLDQLTQKPLAVELTADEKKKMRELLQNLPEKDELSDDEAKKCLDLLLELLKDRKATMEAAGYRWPGAGAQGGFGGGGGPQSVSNPFKQGNPPGNHLKSLNATLTKG